MSENKGITVLGGDVRLITAAKLFSNKITVFCYGWGNAVVPDGVIPCPDLNNALDHGRIILLGIPATVDGTNVNAPLCKEKIRLEILTDLLPCDTVVCGGMLPEVLKNRFVNSIDYNNDEHFQYQNAFLTAEGALMTAIFETDFSLYKSRCLILGSGRIAKALIPLIKTFNADITVIARKKSEREAWKMNGVNAADFDKLALLMETADIVFNTVPSLVLGKEQIKNANKNCVIIDLASRPGGTDLEYAREKGIKAVHALALPGKIAPLTAGKIIYETVNSLLEEKEVMF